MDLRVWKKKRLCRFLYRACELCELNLVQLGNISALGDRRDLGEKTERVSVVFFVSGATEILEHHHAIVAIVCFAGGRLNSDVRRHAAKKEGVHLERA